MPRRVYGRAGRKLLRMDAFGDGPATRALGLPESRWTDAGGPVHYREWEGPENGPVFLMVHGLGGSLLNWALIAPGLASRGRVLALDLAGFGGTTPAGRGSGIGAGRRVVDGFIRALDLPPVVLVGNSMGGVVALAQAAHAPGTVRALVLVGAAFPPARSVFRSVAPGVAIGFLAASSRRFGPAIVLTHARRIGPERLVRATLDFSTADARTIDRRLVAAMVESVEAYGDGEDVARAFGDATRSVVVAFLFPRRYRALVRAVRAPALVVHGARDPLVSQADAWAAVRDHANWSLAVLPDAGHLPQMEVPVRWLEVVDRWLGGQGLGPRASGDPAALLP
jgi:pimeloyl-ACP methyl ester carboxylesterase